MRTLIDKTKKQRHQRRMNYPAKTVKRGRLRRAHPYAAPWGPVGLRHLQRLLSSRSHLTVFGSGKLGLPTSAQDPRAQSLWATNPRIIASPGEAATTSPVDLSLASRARLAPVSWGERALRGAPQEELPQTPSSTLTEDRSPPRPTIWRPQETKSAQPSTMQRTFLRLWGGPAELLL